METKEDIYLNAFGYDLFIPKGTKTTHQTACGIDKNYNFVQQTTDIQYKESETGTYKSVSQRHTYPLFHDLYYHGINIDKNQIRLTDEA